MRIRIIPSYYNKFTQVWYTEAIRLQDLNQIKMYFKYHEDAKKDRGEAMKKWEMC